MVKYDDKEYDNRNGLSSAAAVFGFSLIAHRWRIS
jgi:hypothetical protein